MRLGKPPQRTDFRLVFPSYCEGSPSDVTIYLDQMRALAWLSSLMALSRRVRELNEDLDGGRATEHEQSRRSVSRKAQSSSYTIGQVRIHFEAV